MFIDSMNNKNILISKSKYKNGHCGSINEWITHLPVFNFLASESLNTVNDRIYHILFIIIATIPVIYNVSMYVCIDYIIFYIYNGMPTFVSLLLSHWLHPNTFNNSDHAMSHSHIYIHINQKYIGINIIWMNIFIVSWVNCVLCIYSNRTMRDLRLCNPHRRWMYATCGCRGFQMIRAKNSFDADIRIYEWNSLHP